MNMNDYRQMLDKVTPRDGLKDEIISQCAEKPRITHSFSKRKLAPIFAAAAVLATGTVGVAAATNADWFGKLFEKENVVVTEESGKIIAGVENFTCESDKGISVTPVGVIADERTLYCVLSFDNLPSDISVDDMQIKDFYTNTIPSAKDMLPEEQPANVYGYNTDYGFEQNNMICQLTADYKAFNNGDTVTLKLGRYIEDIPDEEIDVTVSFDVAFGDMRTIEVNYDETEITSNFVPKTMQISPINIMIKGEILFSSYMPLENIEITMSDNSVITACYSGGSGDDNEDKAIWKLEEPINPDNITSVYLGDLCLYTAQ